MSGSTEFKPKDKEEVKQIIETLRKVISLNPDLPYAYNMIVTFMLMLPEFSKDSLDYAKRAIEEMKYEDLYTNLEHVYLVNNQCLQTIDSWEIALKLCRNRSIEFRIDEEKIKSLEEELQMMRDSCK